MLEIVRLIKRFGPLVAVDDVSFGVPAGEVLGFLGPNGAGKSTTMKMVAGFLAPSSGTAVVCGHDILARPLLAKRQIGYLPEGAPAYPDMTAAEFLDFVAHIRGYRGAEARKRVAHIAELINIREVLHQPIETLSKGYRRRVGVAQALLHDPAGGDPRRADRRARPEPEARDARHHPGDEPGQGDHHLDPPARRGRGGVQPRRSSSRAAASWPTTRRRGWPPARAFTMRCGSGCRPAPTR